MNKIELFLKELRESSDSMYGIFTHGSCVRMFMILKILYIESELYWSDRDNHAVTKIGERYYDIGGVVCDEFVKQKEYHFIAPENYDGYKLLKHHEKDIDMTIEVEKYFKHAR